MTPRERAVDCVPVIDYTGDEEVWIECIAAAISQAVAEERERGAKVAESDCNEHCHSYENTTGIRCTACSIAAAIRSGNNAPDWERKE